MTQGIIIGILIVAIIFNFLYFIENGQHLTCCPFSIAGIYLVFNAYFFQKNRAGYILINTG